MNGWEPGKTINFCGIESSPSQPFSPRVFLPDCQMRETGRIINWGGSKAHPLSFMQIELLLKCIQILKKKKKKLDLNSHLVISDDDVNNKYQNEKIP